jgi:hypothetical protein
MEILSSRRSICKNLFLSRPAQGSSFLQPCKLPCCDPLRGTPQLKLFFGLHTPEDTVYIAIYTLSMLTRSFGLQKYYPHFTLTDPKAAMQLIDGVMLISYRPLVILPELSQRMRRWGETLLLFPNLVNISLLSTYISIS